MVGKTLLLCLLTVVMSDSVLLNEGEVLLDAVKPGDSSLIYRISIGSVEKKKQLVVLVGLYSGQQPALCIKDSPTQEECLFKDDVTPGQIVVPSAQLPSLTLYLLVTCTPCKYSLCYHYSKPISLHPNTAISESISPADPTLYTAHILENPMKIHLLSMLGNVTMEVSFMGEEKAEEQVEAVEVEESWAGGVFALLSKPGYYDLSVYSLKTGTYTVTCSDLLSTDQGELQLNQMAFGEVETGSYLHYTIDVLEAKTFLAVHLTQYSGDSDLYISSKYHPSTLEYEFKADSIGNEFLFISEDDRKKVGKVTGTYYIAVYGKVTGAYGLVVREEQGRAKPVLVGLREYGSVRKEKLTQYQVLLPLEIAGKVDVRVEMQSGSVALYGKMCVDPATCSIKKAEIETPSEGIYTEKPGRFRLEMPFEQCLVPCLALVAVYGTSSGTALFFLDITLNSTDVLTLSSSSPYTNPMPAKGELYFRYYEAEEMTEMVEFTLTPISGNPDLYLSTTHPRPSLTNADFISNQLGLLTDSIQLKKSPSRHSLKGNYYLTVHSDVPSAYVLSVTEHMRTLTAPEELLPGIPQEINCEYADLEPCIRRFAFYITGEPKDIRLILISIRGETTLKVTCSDAVAGNDEEYKWEVGAEPLFIIQKEDQKYCETGVYTVLAQTNMSVKEPGRYKVVYSTGQPILVGENMPFRDALEANQVNYYRIRVGNEGKVRVKVQTLAGRTKNYVSYSVQFPGETQSDVKWSGHKQVLLQDCGAPCTAFLAVKGLTNANYTVIVDSEQTDLVDLSIGQLLSGVVDKGYTYYLSHFKRDLPVHILVQPINFDVNVYVNLQSQGGNVVLPTKENSHFKGENGLLLAEYVDISVKAAAELCTDWSCSLVIGVMGFVGGSHFDIEVDQSNVPILLEAKARDISLRNTPSIFRFYLPYDSTTVLVSLTRISGGDPDLYISRLNQPDKTHYEWKSDSYGSDFILISPNDQLFAGRSMRGFYYLAVIADRLTRARVAYMTNIAAPIQLIPGVPQGAVTQANETSYYYISGAQDVDLRIGLTPFAGRPNVYVNTQDLLTEDIFERLPGPGNSIWESGFTHDLIISKHHPSFCANCNYIIGVVAGKEMASYSLVATHEFEMTVMQTGVPIKGSVDSQKFAYYFFPLEQELAGVKVSLMGLSGDVDLFIGFQTPVSPQNAYKYSQSAGGLETLEVTDEALQGHDFLYIGVYGAKAGAYMILLTSGTDRYIRLAEGWSSYYAVHYHSQDSLLFEYIGGTHNSTCKISTPMRYFHLDVYIQETADKKRPIPGPADYDKWYNSSSTEYDEYINQIRFILTGSRNGRHRIGVYGKESGRHEQREIIPFSLYCGEDREAIMMKVGAEDQDTLTEEHRMQRYLVDVPRDVHFEAYISPCCGSVSFTAYDPDTDSTTSSMVLRPGIQFLSLVTTSDFIELQVRLKSLDSDLDSASYHIATRYIGSGTNMQPVIVPGSDGNIIVEMTSSSVNLNWSPLIYQSDMSPVPASAVLYRVYMSKDVEVVLGSYCAMRLAARQHNARRLTKEDLTETHFEFERPKESVWYVTVIAQVSLPDYSYYFSYIHYDIADISGTEASADKGWGRYIGWVLGGTAVVAGLVLVVRWMRKREEDQRRSSEYEMMGGR